MTSSSGIEQRHHDIDDGLLGAVAHDNVGSCIFCAMRLVNCSNRLTQGGNARHGRIMRETFVDCRNGCRANVVGRIKIWFAQSEPYHVFAFCLKLSHELCERERLRFRQHLEALGTFHPANIDQIARK